MKKEYIKPQVEALTTNMECQILEGSWNNHGDAKEQDIVDDEKKPLEDLEFRNIWAEEEEE